jgi:hypothetical protein
MRAISLLLALLVSTSLPACGDDGDPGGAGGGGGEGGDPWMVVLEEQPATFYSVWAPAADDVWVVGTDPGDGPAVLRFDGASWATLPTGTTGSLRWIHGFPGGPVFVGGDGGAILRTTDGSSFERLTTPGTGTVWGLWGASPAEVWAVGGGASGTGAFAWRLDGDAFRADATFPAEVAAGHAAFKVWGRAEDDVWIVGTAGLVLHWDGARFEREDPGASGVDLFTVHGDAGTVIAVGGLAQGFVTRSGGDGAWTPAFSREALLPGLVGVCACGGATFAVGRGGHVLRGDASGWTQEATGLTKRGLHAVAADPAGGLWAVGGRLETDAGDGVVLHREPGR